MTKIKIEYELNDEKILKWLRVSEYIDYKTRQIAEESNVEMETYERKLFTNWRYRFQRFGLTIEGDKKKLKQAVFRFIDFLGVPDFAASGTNYKLLDEVLEYYNMKTKRKLSEAVYGKFVVPITT